MPKRRLQCGSCSTVIKVSSKVTRPGEFHFFPVSFFGMLCVNAQVRSFPEHLAHAMQSKCYEKIIFHHSAIFCTVSRMFSERCGVSAALLAGGLSSIVAKSGGIWPLAISARLHTSILLVMHTFPCLQNWIGSLKLSFQYVHGAARHTHTSNAGGWTAERSCACQRMWTSSVVPDAVCS